MNKHTAFCQNIDTIVGKVLIFEYSAWVSHFAKLKKMGVRSLEKKKETICGSESTGRLHTNSLAAFYLSINYSAYNPF